MADSNHGGSMNQENAAEDIDPRLLQLALEDNVAVAKTDLSAGERIRVGGTLVACDQAIPTGHKVAIATIAAGAKVLKYGAPIGSATCDIQPGQYVHTHNLKSDYLPTYTYDNRAPG